MGVFDDGLYYLDLTEEVDAGYECPFCGGDLIVANDDLVRSYIHGEENNRVRDGDNGTQHSYRNDRRSGHTGTDARRKDGKGGRTK
jgi:hypothetical protein